jgi:hypothetical protein
MAVCKYCGKPIEGEYIMNPDEYGDGYHHSCLIDKQFKEEQHRIYNRYKNDILSKIRAEIEKYRDSMPWESKSVIQWEAINYILEQIIDKYKTESEADE